MRTPPIDDDGRTDAMDELTGIGETRRRLPPEGRRCARAGCRAWTMPGLRFCAGHRAPSGPKVSNAVRERRRTRARLTTAYLHNQPLDADLETTLRHEHDAAQRGEREQRRQAFAAAIRSGQAADALEACVRETVSLAGQGIDVSFELGALRLLLQQVVAIDSLDGDPRQTALTATRLTDAIARLVRMQRTVSGDQADDISSAMTRLLLELGLGEGSGGGDGGAGGGGI